MVRRRERQANHCDETQELTEKVESIIDLYESNEIEGELLTLGHEIAVKKGYEKYINGQNERLSEFFDDVYNNNGVLESALIYAVFLKENKIESGAWYYDNVIENLNYSIQNFKKNTKSGISVAGRCAIAVLLKQLEESIVRSRLLGLSENIAGSLSTLLEHNPELVLEATPLLRNMVSSVAPDERQIAWSVAEKTMSFVEFTNLAIWNLRNATREDTFFMNMSLEAMTNLMMRTGGSSNFEGNWHVEDEWSLDEFMRELCSRINVFERNGHKDSLLNSLFTQGELDNRIYTYLSDGVKEQLIDYVQGLVKKREEERNRFRKTNKFSRNLGYISEIYDSLPVSMQREFISLMGDRNNKEVLKILEEVFGTWQTTGLSEQLLYEEDGVVKEATRKALLNEVMVEIISLMADDPERNKYSLALILAIFPVNLLPEKILDKLSPVIVDKDYELKPCHCGWNLCDSAEGRMIESMYTGAVILVNDSLLVKFKGKLSGVCLRTFTDNKGFTFIKGCWYSPVDDRTRMVLKDSFERNFSRKNLRSSTWALMRKVDDAYGKTGDEIFNEILVMSSKTRRGARDIFGASRGEFAFKNYEGD